MPTIELPARVYKKDRKFQKGMFVAANVKIAEDGTALFGKVDGEIVEKLIEERRCQLCGQRIAKDAWCVFPGSLYDVAYKEAPLHVECARYSMQVCPHIIRKRDTFGFTVCKKYEFVKCEPPFFRDQQAWPHYEGISSIDTLILSFGHRDFIKTSEGDSQCVDCGQSNMGKMTYDEFLKWSA